MGTREQVTEPAGLGVGGMALPGELSMLLMVIANKTITWCVITV